MTDVLRRDLAGVVLGAGHGTRLRPLTTLRPKALCPVGGFPLLDLALGRLQPHTGSGPTSLAVNAHAMAEQVVAHVADRAHVSVERRRALGTAGALGALRPWIAGRDLLLTNADAYLVDDAPAPLAGLVEDWDRERCRLLAVPVQGSGDFDGHRYVGACLLPWRFVAELEPQPSDLYELLWRREHEAGRLELVTFGGTAVDCGTPSDYLLANLHASGGRSLVGDGAVIEGTVERSVIWDGAYVGPREHLVECIRAGTRSDPITLTAPGSAERPAQRGRATRE